MFLDESDLIGKKAKVIKDKNHFTFKPEVEPEVSDIPAKTPKPPVKVPDFNLMNKTPSPKGNAEASLNPSGPLPGPVPQSVLTNKPAIPSWRDSIRDYFESDVCQGEEAFIHRATNLQLLPSDIAMIEKTFHSASEKGVLFSQIISAWRLLESDITPLGNKYPKIHRAITLSRGLRKGFVVDALQAKLHSTPQAALKMLSEPEMLGDPYLESEEREKGKTTADRAEELLLSRGIEPCEYAQVLVLQGEHPTEDHIIQDSEYDFIGSSPESIIHALEQGEK